MRCLFPDRPVSTLGWGKSVVKTWRKQGVMGWLVWGFTLGFTLVMLGSRSLDRVWAMPLPPSRPAAAIQPYLDRVAANITEFRLDNGLKFIVLERHQAPVVSLMTYADVGAVDEPEGKTGVAHFLEHLAFKGTSRIGTRDFEQEQQVLDDLDRAFAQLQGARQDPNSAPEHLDRLEQRFQDLRRQAATWVEQNELSQIIERAGGVGLNATTSTDATRYFYSLPANKLELWMSLESERFLDPVFREFYEEKDVILEERRLRLDNNPVNQLLDAVQSTAFLVHPYGRPVIGEADDIANLSRRDVQVFFQTHYHPDKLTFAVVGDVEADRVQQLAQRYFGRFPAAPSSSPPSPLPPEPLQAESRLVTLQRPTQPWSIVAYTMPAIDDPDYITCQILEQILSSGRTSRLYRALVEEQQIALAAQGTSGYPNDKYPSLMLFYTLPAPGHSLEEVEAALTQELGRLQTELVQEAELQRVTTQVRAGLLRSLDSNRGLASTLVEYEVKTGSWRNFFTVLDRVEQITAADLQRVALKVFQPHHSTIGRLVTGPAEE
ncbi:MAG: pitrilysin family protein [Prochlorothrix sp.]|nr:pitrilysin family protein [Prochlorothrix sp.]